MSRDHRREALPPIGRRPVGPVRTSAAPVEEVSSTPPSSGSGPARLLLGAHALLLIQSALVVAPRADLGSARLVVALTALVSAIALVWGAAGRLRKPCSKSRGDHHDD